MTKFDNRQKCIIFLIYFSIVMAPKMRCECKSFGCGASGGKMQSSRTAHRHIKEDNFLLCKRHIPNYKPVSDFDKYMDLGVYQTHWSVSHRLNKKLSILEYIFEIMREFVSTPNASKKTVTNHLSALKYKVLETVNEKLPDSFEAALKILEQFLIPLNTFNVCPNDCIIYRKDYEHETKCPFCSSERFDVDGKTALRNFTYFPITPRIQRMVATKNLNDLLNKHKSDVNDKFMQSDKQHSKKWKEEWFGEEGMFADVDIGIVLSTCLDGFNPFKQQQINYSMWPIELSVDNFPPAIRKTSAGIMIAGIIPGNGEKEPKLEPYLELLVEELLTLEKCNMTDYTGKTVSVSLRLLQFILDFPAMGKILHLPGSARSFRACPFCQIEGENCTCNKTLFLQNRRYLPPDHSLRGECNGHVNNANEFRLPPAAPLPVVQIRTLRQTYDQLPNNNQKDKFTKRHGLKGCYPFMKLSYHQFQEDMGPDIMHTLKDAASNMSKILNGFIKKEHINKVELEKTCQCKQK